LWQTLKKLGKSESTRRGPREAPRMDPLRAKKKKGLEVPRKRAKTGERTGSPKAQGKKKKKE